MPLRRAPFALAKIVPVSVCPRARLASRRSRFMSSLTHVTEDNRPTMKSVTNKRVTKRLATAVSSVLLPPVVLDGIQDAEQPKDDDGKHTNDTANDTAAAGGSRLSLCVSSSLVGIKARFRAVKRTSDLIPFCHPLPIEACTIDVQLEPQPNGLSTDVSFTGACLLSSPQYHRRERRGERGRGLVTEISFFAESSKDAHFTAAAGMNWKYVSCRYAKANIECTVEVTSKTGVEMEALTGASVCALTIYDMLKALSQEMVIENTKIVRKTGGKSDIGGKAFVDS
eukprot:jgi/Bigna1/72704/fgenesh1_pg.21_\